jgi:uncharacterized protein YcbK (DUF882 family)/flagellar hook-basal body complex protein FliE
MEAHMAGVQAGSAGRLSIEIVAEIARLDADLRKAKALVNAASGDIAKSARAANDNLASIGVGAGKGMQQFARDVAALKGQLDPAWASMQKYRQEVEVAQRALAQGAITHGQYVQALRQSATAAGLLKDKQAEAAAAAQLEAQAQRDAALATQQAAAAAQEAARQQAAYAAQASALRAQLDPMYAAQQRFNQALDQAETLFRAGAITSREYAAAQRLARDALQDHARAVTGTRNAVEDLSPAIAKTSSNARQFSLQMSQVGQQVMAGTSLIQALAMQLPDVAAGMNANQAGAGKFATFLMGPWGIAVTSAIALAVSFGAKLLDTDDATKKAEKGQRSFADVLSDGKKSWVEITKAAKDYADQQQKNRALTIDEIKRNAALAASNLKTALSIREKLAADLEAYETISRRGAQSEAGDVARAGAFARADLARENIAKNEAALKSLTRAANEASIAAATAIAELNVDPAARLRAGYDQLEKSAKAHFGSTAELTKRLTDLGKGEQAALERLSEANRKHSTDTIKLARVTGEEIAKALGTTITSGFRTAEKNAAVHGAKNSAHLTGRAIDIPLTVNGRPLSKEGIRAALEPLGYQIGRILGPGDRGHNDHFHIPFSIKRLDGDQVRNLQEDAAEAARKAAEKAEDEMQKFRMHVLETSIEMAEAMAKAVAPGLAATQQKEWDAFDETVRRTIDGGLDPAYDAMAKLGQVQSGWNEELVRTIDFLDQIGTNGRALGDIGGALLGLTTGDFSGSRGPLGGILQSLGNMQWRGPADANGLGEIKILREEIVNGLDEVFGAKGAFASTMTDVLKGAGTGAAIGGVLFAKRRAQSWAKALLASLAKPLVLWAQSLAPLRAVCSAVCCRRPRRAAPHLPRQACPAPGATAAAASPERKAPAAAR